MRTRIASLALLMACGVAAAKDPTVIAGRLVGADGKPLRKAHVHLAETSHGAPIASVEAGKDGTFRLSTERTGLFFLQMSGVDHQLHEVPVLIERPEPVKLDVRLKANQPNPSFENVRVIGEFNNYAFGTGVAMSKDQSGVYVAEIPTNAPSFPYQLLGVIGDRSVNGTESEDFVYDGGGDYRSIVTPKGGKVRIVFDPRKLPRSTAEPSVAFADPRSTTAQLSTIMTSMLTRQDEMYAALRAHYDAGGTGENFTFAQSDARAGIEEQLKSERNPILRQALLIGYLSLAGDLDSTVARSALKEVPPASELWALRPGAIRRAISYLPPAEQSTDAIPPYIRRVIDGNRSVAVKSEVLFGELQNAFTDKREADANLLYKKLTTEFPKSQYAKIAQERMDPNAAIRDGKNLPAFSVASLDEPGATYTNATFKGKVYLIDFWATWCRPCVQEMAALHQAYEKYHNRNFEIISLSFDAKPADIAKFRSVKWNMPWKHAFVENGFKSDLARTFEVFSIPRPILVDGSGRILATNEMLRGENLEKTLASVLGTAQ